MAKEKNGSQKMRLLDDPEETESGMYLSMLADKPGEAEAAMVLNSLVDDKDKLNQEAAELIEAAEKLDNHRG